MSQLDLLVLSPVSTLGGTERVAFQIARGVKRAGRSVEVRFKQPIEQPQMTDWYRAEGIPFSTTTHLKPLRPRRLLSAMLGLRREVKALAPCAVNLQNPGNTILATDVLALRLAGVRRIVCSLHHPLDPESLPRSWKLSTAQAARWTSSIVVTTPVLQATVAAMGVPASAMTIVGLGVEPLARTMTREAARGELGLGPETFVVGALGRMEAYKRMDAVIRACASLPAFQGHGMLLLVGGGPEEERWRALAADLLPNNHRFLGRVEDSSAFYQALDVFALPSELEGFGLVYGEAGLAGVPSIGCDAGGARYAIRNGETGVLIPVEAPDATAGVLAELMADPERIRRMGDNARRFANTELSMARFESEYLRLFFDATS